jgi:hypothetical protein
MLHTLGGVYNMLCKSEIWYESEDWKEIDMVNGKFCTGGAVG